MEAFLISTGIVALAEIGDKTQLLAFILAARFKKPVPIITGDMTMMVDGKAVARNGDKTACGAVLIAGQMATVDNV